LFIKAPQNKPARAKPGLAIAQAISSADFKAGKIVFEGENIAVPFGRNPKGFHCERKLRKRFAPDLQSILSGQPNL
jgi:hypothetical protein